MIYADVNIKNISADEYEKWYHLMSDSKKAKVHKLRFNDDKKRSIAGEMLAKKAIAEFLSISAEEITFSADENGKPYAVGLPAEFNISHSCDLVVCAVNNIPVGVDVEKIRPVKLKIAKKFFTPTEQVYLFGKKPTEQDYNTEPDEPQLQRLFEIWTGKEAYLKYTGTGLTKNLDSVDIDKARLEQMQKDGYIISIFR